LSKDTSQQRGSQSVTTNGETNQILSVVSDSDTVYLLDDMAITAFAK